MASNDTSRDPEITQSCPVVRLPNPEPPQFPVAWAWKGLLATTAVVMGVGAALAGVNDLQANYRTLSTEVNHLAVQPAITPSVPAAPAANSTAPLLTQAQVPWLASGAGNVPALAPLPAAPVNLLGVIDEPVNGAVIHDTYVRVSGHVTNGINQEIWALVFPERSPGRGWPQSGDASRGVAAVRIGNTFRVGAFLGGPPQEYDVVVYSAPPEASRLFSVYLQNASRSGQHHGISAADMPTGLQELARVTIRRERTGK